VPLAIYYFYGGIIGRGSGRSSVGAAAYRAADKLRAHPVNSAAYRSGEELRDGEGEVVHDYSKKGGVVHSEIILPQGAPPEYRDRETLWNAVERAEKRRDAQLAREFVVALPREFDLPEQVGVMREYVRDNFVIKGMIGDFAIHDKGDGNPHAHIMLTTRRVSPDGFGFKNRDWNRDSEFLGWRKNWAEVVNRKLEEKGFEERIDHRSYRAQGVDREPMVHLGYKDAALEKKGIRTERGDYNREVQRRNLERAAKNAEHVEVSVEKPDVQYKVEKLERLEEELQKIREYQKTAPYIENPPAPELDPPFVSELEKQLKAEKAMQHVEKMREQQDNAEQIAKRMNVLKEKYVELESEKITLIAQNNRDKLELPPLEYRAEQMEEHAENIVVLQGRITQLHESRRNVRLLEFKKKKDTDEKIAYATHELGRAQDFFKNRFNVDPSHAREELKRLQEEIRTKQNELNTKQIIVQAIREKQEKLELAYHTQKLLNDTRPDKEQITQLLEQTRQPPESVREKILRERIEHQLNTITDNTFQKVIDTLPPYQAHILINIREQAKERERLKEIEKERNRSIDRSR
jgi:hypothetical protein